MNRRILLSGLAVLGVALLLASSSAEAGLFGKGCCEPATCVPATCEPATCCPATCEPATCCPSTCKPGLLARLKARQIGRASCWERA